MKLCSKDIKVSVIVPVYNSANYITETLDSLVRQTLQEIEVVCVDDCSQDNSVKIIEDYIEKDNRIKLIKNPENKKQGYSRNIGLDIAKGEYVAFLDSDDFIDVDFYEVLYNMCKKDSSEIAYACIKKFQNNKVKVSFTHKNKLAKTIEEKYSSLVNGSACDKLFKKSFLDKYKLKFPEGIFLKIMCLL